MSRVAIKAENLSKAYQLGEFTTGTLSRDIQRKIALMRGKEDPYLKIGQTNDRTSKGTSDIVWSLKDINFDINQGDAVGIIGRNGAGKSTLLKVLSRVTTPTTGSVKIKGRVASLLEVGTGFHPELTGRENIFLNGAILGMRKHEIKRHFDAIVDFAGVERYIDTPVKRYSSGMYVRLAFAVAAHLQSEILIVDEVLAVGDAEFQKKCLGKMGEVSKGEGRTVLFVSHNMGSIAQLCRKGIYLRNGLIESSGEIEEILIDYISGSNDESSYVNTEVKTDSYFSEINYYKEGRSENSNSFLFHEDVVVKVKIINKEVINDLTLSIVVKDSYDVPLFSSHYQIPEELQARDSSTIQVTIPAKTLIASKYKIEPILHVPNAKFVDKITNDLVFQIEDSGSGFSKYHNARLGKLIVPIGWAAEVEV